jgi:hypothetical protein
MYANADNLEIAEWCCKLLISLFQEFRGSQTVAVKAFNWFSEKEGGFELCLHAINT